MATVANLDVNLRANTSKFDSNITKSGNVVAMLKSGVVAAGASITAAFAAATTAATKFIAVGDDIDKIAARTQLAAEDVQSLAFAFEQNGGSATDLETSVRSLNRNILDLQRGSATAVDNFRDLGITMHDLNGLNQAERFRLVAKALQGIEDESIRSGVALKVFGRSGSQLLPLIKNMDELERQFGDLGLGFSNEEIKLAAAVTDEINILTKSITKLGAELAIAFGPGLVDAIRSASKFIREIGLGVASLRDYIESLSVTTSRGTYDPNEIVSGNDPISQYVKSVFEDIRSVGEEMQNPPVDLGPQRDAAMGVFEGGIVASALVEVAESVKENTQAISPLPQALLRGQAETIGFINNLNRQNDAEEVKKLAKKHVDIAKRSDDKLAAIAKSLEVKPTVVEVL